MCANFPPNRTTFSVKVLARRNVAQPKGTNFTRCLTYTASNQKRLSQSECGKSRLCMYFNQLLPLCVCQFSSKSNNSQRKRAGEEKKWSKQKAQTSRHARPIRLPIMKSWVKGNLGSWDFTRSLVNYLHYVYAKIHPNRTTFSVRRLARKKLVNGKSTHFTRCSIYSASQHKLSGQEELRKLKLCI